MQTKSAALTMTPPKPLGRYVMLNECSGEACGFCIAGSARRHYAGRGACLRRLAWHLGVIAKYVRGEAAYETESGHCTYSFRRKVACEE